MLVVRQGIARCRILQAHRGGDIAGIGRLQILAVICMHEQYSAHALTLALGHVYDRLAGVHRAGIHTEERELAHVGVGHYLEGQSRERLVVARLAGLGLASLGVRAFDGRNVEGAGQIIDYRVQQLLHALVFVGRAAGDGYHLDGDGGLADGCAYHVGGDLLALQIALHDLIIEIGDGFKKVRAVLLGQLAHVLGYLLNAHVLAQIIVIDVRLHVHKVNYAAKIGFLAYGQLDGHGVRLEPVMDHVYHVEEIRAHDVHLVDIDETWYVVMVGLAPHSLRLGLDSALRAEHGHAAVQHAQAALDLDGEVHVARRVDNVQPAAAPVAGRGGARYRDAALLLLLHPVHRSGALVRLAYLIVDARIEQYALRGRGLARVDVGHYADVSRIFKRKFSGHRTLLNFLPPEMCEGLVGLGHLVSILTLLDSGAEAVAGVHYLAGKALLHGLLAALAGVQREPAQAESLTALGTDLDRHLVGGAAHAAGLDFQAGHDVVHGLGESLKGILPGLVFDYIERIVHDLLCDALLAVQHDAVDELGHQHAVIHRIRQDLSLGNVTSSGHYTSILH